MASGATIEAKVTGVAQVQMRLLRFLGGLRPATDAATELAAHRLVKFIKEEIHKQDLIDTEQYLNSWVVVDLGNGRWAASTDAPQSDRLEYGFVATDSLGRSYAEPPRPHRGPAMERAAVAFREDLNKVVPRLWGR